MPSEKLGDRHQKPSASSKAKSSLVHKPFATGTINIFNPHRSKSQSKPNSAKLLINAELERDLEQSKAEFKSELNPEPDEIEYREQNWLDSLMSFWGISAIAVLVTVNLVSAGYIWRNSRNPVLEETKPSAATIGNRNLVEREFVPLDLGTLGTIQTTPEPADESTLDLAPIAPALAPLDNIASLTSFNTPYHYILTEYTGEESLFLAQQKAPQVSLVNFPQGVLIYMGAFKNREDADTFVTRLKQDNFSATVYPLD